MKKIKGSFAIILVFILLVLAVPASATSVTYINEESDLSDYSQSYNGYIYINDYSFEYVISFNEYDEKTAYFYISDIDSFKDFLTSNSIYDNNSLNEYILNIPESDIEYNEYFGLRYIDENAYNYIISYSAPSQSAIYLEEMCQGAYKVLDSESNVIDVVISNEFINYLDEKYTLYESWENKSKYSFQYYLYSVITSEAMQYNEVAEIVSLYSVSKLSNDIYSEFEKYKENCNSNSVAVTDAGFKEYLQSTNYSLYDEYVQSFATVSSEMYSAGASSSSSSSGSHGSSSSVPSENQGTNYGASHTGGSEAIGSDCCYNPGYNDGLLDGGENFQNSEEYTNILNENSTQAVEEYLKSEEYTSALENYKTEVAESAVNSFKEGDEYQLTIDSSYAAGSDAGYTNAYEDACSEVYNRGKTDGYAEFRGSMEYSKAVNSAYSSGWDDGVDKARESVVNPGGVIASIFILAGLMILLFILSRKKRKKNK